MKKQSILDTGVRRVRNVGGFQFGSGSLDQLPQYIAGPREQAKASGKSTSVVFLVDEFFEHRPEILARLGTEEGDQVKFVSTKKEPTTEGIDRLVAELLAESVTRPAAIVGIGGGITLDTAKAVSNLLTNGGTAAQYQGWDLVKVPGIYKIAVPTISGTGAEATRTCVMINEKTGLKLGMNSDHTVFDQLILDPDLPATVPRSQYFYTGMDAFIHSVESMAGNYRNPVGDAYSRETIALCRQVFHSDDMMSPDGRQNLMVASYLGGCAIATSYVGLVHPFSAGLSVVLGLHHCVANCIALRALAEYYPEACAEFEVMLQRQGVRLPDAVCSGLSDAQLLALYESTIIHEKPLTNALGENYRDLLNFETVSKIFCTM